MVSSNSGRTRIHQLENVSNALNFLHAQGAHLENLGAQDIVDGNPSLTLGLIWKIILHFHVQNVELREVGDNTQVRRAKDALLRWCQIKTASYPEVQIINFTSSWRNGLAFCALLHRHYSHLLDYQLMLSFENEPWKRLEIAFQQASNHLGIPKLVDPMDLTQTCWMDERCILTLVVTWYRWLNESQYVRLATNRVGHVLDQCIHNARMISRHIKDTKHLLQMLGRTTKQLVRTRCYLNEYHTKSTGSGSEDFITDICAELRRLSEWRQKEKVELIALKYRLEGLLCCRVIETIRSQVSLCLQYHNELCARTEKVEQCLHDGQELYETFQTDFRQLLQEKFSLHSVIAPKIVIDTGSENGIRTTEDDQEGGRQLLAYSEEMKPLFGEFKRISLGTESYGTTDPGEVVDSDTDVHIDITNPLDDVHSSTTADTKSGSNQDTETAEILGSRNRSSNEIKPPETKEEIQSQHAERIERICSKIKCCMAELLSCWYELQKRWYEIYRKLTLKLNTAIFMCDLNAMERWLELHEPDLNYNELGDSVESTNGLIQRHQILIYNLSMQAGRFARLMKPTLLEIEQKSRDWESVGLHKGDSDWASMHDFTVSVLPWTSVEGRVHALQLRFELNVPIIHTESSSEPEELTAVVLDTKEEDETEQKPPLESINGKLSSVAV
ncbi:unnamed protein product [Dicrocoelium dendriticum]|nr:unnamed protein product [Dicrocoelium dendriticum]